MQFDENVKVEEDDLEHVAKNIQEFVQDTPFQKTVLSILAGLQVQKEELGMIKKLFIEMDNDENGTLSKEELHEGL